MFPQHIEGLDPHSKKIDYKSCMEGKVFLYFG